MDTIARISASHVDEWVAMRGALWPEADPAELRNQGATMLSAPDRFTIFIALAGESPVGFIEASIRSDYVNGCETSPVAFVEGMYVKPAHRRRGTAHRLCKAVEAWAERLGLRELASDALIENAEGQEAHRALGFAETERVVYFRKRLSGTADQAGPQHSLQT